MTLSEEIHHQLISISDFANVIPKDNQNNQAFKEIKNEQKQKTIETDSKGFQIFQLSDTDFEITMHIVSKR